MAKRKKKKNPALYVLLLAAVLALLGGLLFLFERRKESTEHLSMTEYFSAGADELVLIRGGEAQLAGKLFDGEPYLLAEAASTSIDPRYYYDAAEGLFIETSETEVKLTSLQDLSDSSFLREEDGKLYLSYEHLAGAREDLRYLEGTPPRVVLPVTGTYLQAALTDDAPIRYRAGIKSPIVYDGTAGMPLVVLDTRPDGTQTEQYVEGWAYVLTEDGIKGYVRRDKISEAQEMHREEALAPYRHLLLDRTINLAFHQTDHPASNEALPKLLATTRGLTHVAPTWFFLDATDGTLRSGVSKEYVEVAHAAGLDVWAVINDFDGNCRSTEETAAFLQSYASRTRAITQMMDEGIAAGIDGINVDIEKVSEKAAPAFLQFLRELSVSCKNAGLVLSVDNYVPTYTKYMNRAEQARVCDYLLVMCYDEHTKGSEEAGSVSSLPFFTDGIAKTLEEVPKEQLLAGIPFYTRVWKTTSSAAPDCATMGIWNVRDFLAERDVEVVWDEPCGQHYVEFQEDLTFYQIWIEDAASLEEKMKVVEAFDLAGVGAWKLGGETQDIWDVLEAHLK